MAFEFKISIKNSWASKQFTLFHCNGVGVGAIASTITQADFIPLKRLKKISVHGLFISPSWMYFQEWKQHVTSESFPSLTLFINDMTAHCCKRHLWSRKTFCHTFSPRVSSGAVFVPHMLREKANSSPGGCPRCPVKALAAGSGLLDCWRGS